MVKTIKWSPQSIHDLQEICDYISQDSLYYAELLRDRIFEMVEHLSQFSSIGRSVPEADDPSVKEIFYKGYRIIYQIHSYFLEIITVIHGSRLLKW
jgi:plasmid stabilization system protein ParE